MKKRLRFIIAVIVLIGVGLLLYFKIFQTKVEEEDPVTDDVVLTTVKVGYLPSLAASQMYIGIAKGYFEEEGLELEIQEILSGPEIISTLQSKSVDVAFGIVPSLVIARSNGASIKSIAGGTVDNGSVREHRLMLPIDSPIENGMDLKGKKIALVAEGTSDYFGLVQYLNKHGLTTDDVELIKTPHPNMIVAVASKSVDVAAGIEPFITLGEVEGKTKVFDYYYPDTPTEIGTYLSHEDYIAQNPQVVSAFSRAINKATVFIQNEDSLRAMLPVLEEYGIKFKISEEVANRVIIMKFQPSLTPRGVQNIIDQLA